MITSNHHELNTIDSNIIYCINLKKKIIITLVTPCLVG